MSVEIYVASHRQVNIELPDCYKMVQVNARKRGEHWEGFIHDDSGENISEKNDCYCELTAMYWGWKNSQADIKGLSHYRRYFSREDTPVITGSKAISSKKIKELCLQENEIVKVLRDYDVILQMPYIPYPSSAEENLKEFCYEKDIEILEAVIKEKFADYKSAYLKVMRRKNLSYCNMLIARKTVYNSYCEWLFAVLDEVEKRCDISTYDQQHKRIYGYLAEVLLNVYVEKNRLKAKYYTPLYVESYDKKEFSFMHIRHKVHVIVFDILGKLNGQLLEWVASKYRKGMYDRYIQCKNYLSQKEEHER